MAQICKIESLVSIKAPADQMYAVWSARLHQLTTAWPEKVKSVELDQGEWGKQGSVIFTAFFHEENLTTDKEKYEVIDDVNKVIVFKAIEGGPLRHYKSFKWTYKASPENKMVHWTMEYEKHNDDDPEPTSFLQLAVDLTKAVDAYLSPP